VSICFEVKEHAHFARGILLHGDELPFLGARKAVRGQIDLLRMRSEPGKISGTPPRIALPGAKLLSLLMKSRGGSPAGW
jgi:hypothetical protein